MPILRFTYSQLLILNWLFWFPYSELAILICLFRSLIISSWIYFSITICDYPKMVRRNDAEMWSEIHQKSMIHFHFSIFHFHPFPVYLFVFSILDICSTFASFDEFSLQYSAIIRVIFANAWPRLNFNRHIWRSVSTNVDSKVQKRLIWGGNTNTYRQLKNHIFVYCHKKFFIKMKIE